MIFLGLLAQILLKQIKNPTSFGCAAKHTGDPLRPVYKVLVWHTLPCTTISKHRNVFSGHNNIANMKMAEWNAYKYTLDNNIKKKTEMKVFFKEERVYPKFDKAAISVDQCLHR